MPPSQSGYGVASSLFTVQARRLGGRPAKLNPDQVRTARRLYDERELTTAEIGRIRAKWSRSEVRLGSGSRGGVVQVEAASGVEGVFAAAGGASRHDLSTPGELTGES